MHDSETIDVADYLGALPLFANMSVDERERVADGSQLRELDSGRVLFHVGDACNEFHVVIQGQVKIFVLSRNGAEKVVHLCGPRQNFGEAFMFLNMPYGVSAQTLTDTLLLTVSKAAVMGEIDRNPDFARRMLAGLSRQLHGLISDVQSYALHSGVQRVIGYLLGDRLAARELTSESLVVSLPVSKSVIASRLSITPEYFSRVLGELEGADLIHVDRRDIHIPDTAALAEYRPM